MSHDMTEVEALRAIQHGLENTLDMLPRLQALITKVHSAKGRYHTQIAMCDLYDAAGLPNERPKK